MTADMLPEYEYAVETLLHLRCTSCGEWWSLVSDDVTRGYFCPWCGVKMAPAEYADERPLPATTMWTPKINPTRPATTKESQP